MTRGLAKEVFYAIMRALTSGRNWVFFVMLDGSQPDSYAGKIKPSRKVATHDPHT